jgi:hypothetical protein
MDRSGESGEDVSGRDVGDVEAPGITFVDVSYVEGGSIPRPR